MMLPKTKRTYLDGLFLFAAFAVFVAGFFLFFKTLPAVGDEVAHARYIAWITQGTDFFPNGCPYLPGYHYMISVLYWLTHFRAPTPLEFLPLCSPSALHFFPTMLRLLSSAVSFICLIVFFLLAKTIDRETAVRKTSLFLFFPIYFPFFFLIYTDIGSMLYVLLCLLFVLRKRLWLAGFFGILSLLLRQNNILWIALACLIAYHENYYPQWRWKDIKPWISKFSVFFIAGALFTAFVLWNKGLVLGDRTHHSLSLRLDNLFYLLFFYFFLFLPYNISKAEEILAFLKKHKLAWLVLIEIFFLYIFFFTSNHLYNSTEGVFGLFLHNHVTAWMQHPGVFHRILSFSPIAYSLLSLSVTRLQRPSFYLLYPFTILFLLPNEVIEVRYIFIPLALFLLFKEKDSWRMTLATLGIYGIALALLIPLLTVRFFI